MAHQPVSRNAKCPCGSGKKYKHCCLNKGYEFEQDESGAVRRSIPMSDDLSEMLGSHIDGLADELGREPGPDDQLFPSEHVEHMEHGIVQAMLAAGLDPAMIYAFEQTGLLVGEDNEHLISDADRTAWHDAIAEYHAREQVSAGQYPMGTIAIYGPDDTVTTKIVASVLIAADSNPILERFVGMGIAEDRSVQQKIEAFFREHGVKQVIAADRNMGCPHEEGEDFPVGGDCPFCPFWKGKQGSGADPELADSAGIVDADDATAHCWSCGKEIPATAQRCLHCEADVEDGPSAEEQASVMQMMEQMGPEFMQEIENVFAQSTDGEDFVNRIMVGPCPKCDSDNTSHCENDPEIEDPCVGHCLDCGQLWCCDCEKLFGTAKEAVAHDCPFWDAMEDELEGI